MPVQVAQGDPAAPRRQPVQLDDPAQQLGRGLVPEGLLALAVKLRLEGDQLRGQAVGVHLRNVQRVPGALPVQPDLDVVAPPPAVLEDLAHLVAEVALDLQHQPGGPQLGIARPPGQDLLGQRTHAAGGLAAADGPGHEHAGIQALGRQREPCRPRRRPRLDGVVLLAEHRQRLALARLGPPRQPAAAGGGAQPRPPHLPQAQRGRADDQGRRGGPGVVPGLQRVQQPRVVVRDQVQGGRLARPGPRVPAPAGQRGQPRGVQRRLAPERHGRLPAARHEKAATRPSGPDARRRLRRRRAGPQRPPAAPPGARTSLPAGIVGMRATPPGRPSAKVGHLREGWDAPRGFLGGSLASHLSCPDATQSRRSRRA